MNIKSPFLLFIFMITVSLFGCKKKEPVDTGTIPSVATYANTGFITTSGTFNGEVLNENGDAVIQKGFCWAKHAVPTINDTFSIDGSGIGIFFHDISNMEGDATFYVRAYATNKYGTDYGSEISFQTVTPAIGLSLYGGIIFYLDGTGEHGLVCMPADDVNNLWGNTNLFIGCTTTAIGQGKINTLAAVQADNTHGAPYECYDAIAYGYDDWFLPSRDELDLMRVNLCLNNIGNFFYGYYWSSTENSFNSAIAIKFDVSGDVSISYKGATNTIHVRPVRAF